VVGVNRERAYTSPLRAQQAAATRKAVLDAARALFVEQGYGATTVDQIAARAGVSKPTVFTAVGNKQTVLSAVRDVAMAGDDETVSVVERPLAQRVLAEPDQRRSLQLLAEHITGLCRRYAEIDRVLSGAAGSGDVAIRGLWQTSEDQRLAGARIWAESLHGKGPSTSCGSTWHPTTSTGSCTTGAGRRSGFRRGWPTPCAARCSRTSCSDDDRDAR
jgi:AcrR family transcriptional regulator